MQQDLYFQYYSRKDVQEAMLKACENREVVPRYGEGFGKRPDVLQYPGDILEMAKRGATSFHISEEHWHDPLILKPGMSKKDLDENRKGWDLCLPDFENIYILEDNLLKRVPIVYLSKFTIPTDKPYEFLLSKDFFTLTLNPSSYNIEFEKITTFFVRNKNKEEKVFRIILEDGKELFVSEDHPLLVFTSEGIKNKIAKNITPEDYLLISTKISPTSERDSFNILEELFKDLKQFSYFVGKDIQAHKFLIKKTDVTLKIPSSIAKYFSKRATPISFFDQSIAKKEVLICMNRCKDFIPSHILLSRDFGFLCGMYLSEACSSRGRIEFSLHINEYDIAEKIISIINKSFKLNISKNHIENNKGNGLRVRISSTILQVLFEDVFGFKKKAYKKIVPAWAFNANSEFIDGLLEGYFVGDGHSRLDSNGKSLTFSVVSVSQSLIEGIAFLLQIRSIKYKIRKNLPPQKNSLGKHNRNILSISGEEDIISLFKNCPEVFKRKHLQITPKTINHPSIHDRFPPFFDRNKIKQLNNEVQKKNLYRAIRLKMRVHKKLASTVANEDLRKIMSSQVFPLRCKKIEQYNYNGLLYDIQTEKNHNFLQGDGIFSHNCLDIDTVHWDYAKWTAYFLIEALKFHDVKNISIKYSGSKGFHIAVPFASFPEEVNGVKTQKLFPEGPRIITAYLQNMIHEMLANKILEKESVADIAQKTNVKRSDLVKEGKFNPFAIIEIDTVLISNRHLFRAPYSLHEKTGLVSLPIDKDKVLTFDKREADPKTVKAEKGFLETLSTNDGKNLIMQAMDWWGKKHAKQGPDVVPGEKRERTLPTDAVQEICFPQCMQKILAGNMEDGKKRALFILVNFLRHMNWNDQTIESRLKEWNSKNKNPLPPSYISTQLIWNKKQKESILPPNCNKSYYKDLRVSCPENICSRFKNPVNCALRAHAQAKEQEKKVKKVEEVKK